MTTTHYHILVWCAERKDNGNFIDNAVVDVIASSTGEAIERAQALIPGKGVYSVRSVIEHFGSECVPK